MKQAFSPLREWRFLVSFSKRHTRNILSYTVLTAVLSVCEMLCGLLLLPLTLRYIDNAEQASILTHVALPIALWLLLHILAAYSHTTLSRLRDALRTRGGTQLVHLSLTSSYAEAVRPEQKRVLRNASCAMGQHVNAPIPHAFQTVCDGLSHALITLILTAPLSLHFPLAAAATTATALISAIVHRVVTVKGHHHKEQETAHDDVLSYLSPIAGSTKHAKDIRMFGLAPWLRSVRNSSMQALRALICRRAAVFFVYNVTDALLTLLRNAIAYSILIYECLTSELPAWECVFFLLCITSLTNAVSGLLTTSADLREELVAVSYYRHCVEQLSVKKSCGKQPAKGTAHTLTLRNASFTYPDADKPSLQNVSLTLHGGERLAIVGTDKRAKTAVAKLLCGLIEPDEGAVMLDGTDVREFDRNRYFALFSTILQSGILPGMTVAENISLQTEKINEDRVWDCLEKADAAKAVCALRDGIHTPLEDTTLSGGQLQRLLLARALFKNGDIFLLDEPTSALDPLAEHALYREYRRLTEGKSAVFISQRLASTRFCDRVVLLQDGCIIEEGTHDELMNKGGEYARLFELQSRYYREGRNPDASH